MVAQLHALRAHQNICSVSNFLRGNTALELEDVQNVRDSHGRNLVEDTGDVSPHFFRRGDIICHVPPAFFSLSFVFGEVLFVTFCVKSCSC